MKQRLSITLLLVLILSACRPADITPEPRTLTVDAASSLTEAFTEIGRNFEAAHPGVTVVFNFANSRNLCTQIEQGAQADVFASANSNEMDELVKAGFVQENAPQIFLTNQLVVILPADNPAGIVSLEDLGRPGLKLILTAEEVPAGKYAREVLGNLNTVYRAEYKDEVLANVVSNEDNVKQVVAKVQLGEADAGIVYVSDAVAAPELRTLSIPADANVIAAYPIAPLVDSKNFDLSSEFITYVLSSTGQAVLRKWGFTPVAQ